MRKILSAIAIVTIVLVGLSSAASAQYSGEEPAGAEQAPADVEAVEVTVTADTLPRTGDDSLPLARIGAILVAAGGLMVLTARKRRANAPSPV